MDHKNKYSCNLKNNIEEEKYLSNQKYDSYNYSAKTKSFLRTTNQNLFKNTYNYDIAFLSENISEWDDI